MSEEVAGVVMVHVRGTVGRLVKSRRVHSERLRLMPRRRLEEDKGEINQFIQRTKGLLSIRPENLSSSHLAISVNFSMEYIHSKI